MVLRKLRSKVVICEEAGEVLEAHILTALLPSVEHAVLIGDHLQLRPQIQNYELQSTNPRGEQYSLDTSLFERLVQPPHLTDKRLPVSMLDTQRRMHPSIAEMVRSTLYPSLEDAENVKSYPPVVGMRHRLYWMRHERLESGVGAHDPQDTSRSNDFEVEMTAALVSHLVRQGHYSPEDIAVLTPYLGQLQKLRRRMAAEATFAVKLDDRDMEGLDELGDDTTDSNGTVSPNGGHVAKTTLLRSIRLATVDNFQGEEAKIVVISLVRSNPENRCGFLSTSNRINVLLSRAQHGCYIIGNSNTYEKVPMWNKIICMLQADGNFGPRLPLQCPRHPFTPIHVSQPDHFAQFAPDGGCNLNCDKRLSCGHSCPAPCHSDLVHAAVKCLERCPRAKKGCDHDCPRVCGDQCEDKCHVRMKGIHLLLPCGHSVDSAECWETQNAATIRCKEMVDRTVPGCGHVVTLPCCIVVDGPEYKCKTTCGTILSCGHACRSPCWRCHERKDGEVVKSNHGICGQVCGRGYNACPHNCEQKCHGEVKCPPCTKPCEVRCSHSRCGKPCHEPCTPCAEEKCASRCPHTRCTMPCAAPCDWVPCSKRCSLTLACGHHCPSLCGEVCPDVKYCQQCGSEQVLSTVVDFYEMNEYRGVDLDADPCLFLGCGHFFTKNTMDHQMTMSEYYELDENECPVLVRFDATKAFSMDEVKVCPMCRGSLRNIARYGRIVRRAMLDEASKKFITWAEEQYLKLFDRLLKEQSSLETLRAGQDGIIGEANQKPLKLTGNSATQVFSLSKWAGKTRYKAIAKLFLDISKHLHSVNAEEQPFQRVADLVRHANRTHRTRGIFIFDKDIIQMKGYLMALSLLIKCNIVILSDFVSLWRTIAASGDGDLIVDFAANMAQCEGLIKGATDTKRPQYVVDGHIYYAKFCGFAIALPKPQANGVATPSTVPGPGAVPTEQTDPRDALKKQGLAHLEAARALLDQHAWPSKPMLEAEIESAERMLYEGVFYNRVSAQELRDVYQAMAKEFSGTGHWYTCENGHPFTIGECGMAMQLARCPECGAPVGGEDHQAAEGVRYATEIDELARDMDGVRIR